MAKVLTTRVDEHRTSSVGTWILLTVSVAVLVVMAVSVPHLIGRSGWATGEKFLYLALLGYLGASVLFVFSLVVRQSNLVAGAEALTRGSLLLHTGAIVSRWVTSGHAPLSNIYEMVLVFSWAVVVLQEVAEWKLEIPFSGRDNPTHCHPGADFIAGATGGDQASRPSAPEHVVANSRYAGDAELRGLYDFFRPSLVVPHKGRGQRAHFP